MSLQIKAGGNADELIAELKAMAAEAQHSILEPQPNGQPWDDGAILAWKAEHDALTAEIRARHEGGAK
ncbi:MAG: hypothetical protein ABI634_18315 [Acidobacteriota bacterium]